MSETTLKSVSEAKLSKEDEIIQIEEENSVTIDIEDTGQEESEKNNRINCDKSSKDNKGDRGVEYTVYYNTANTDFSTGFTAKTDLNTGFRPQAQKHWIFLGIADAATNQVPPTGSPLDYDPESRNGFVRLVFTIVLIMLLFTCGFNAAVYNIEFLSDIFEDRMLALCMLIGASLVMYVMNYVMFCSQCSRSAPCNYICLFVVALAMSIIVACVSIRYKMTMIALSMAITTIITLVCLALACTNFDFTKYLLYFIVISTALTLVGSSILLLKFVFKWDIKPLHMGILVVFVILSAIGMVMELQMILGGKTVELGEEDYAIGAFMLYTSIIQMFMLILRILNLADGDV